MERQFQNVVEICKVDEEMRTVFGWASVIKEGSEIVVDTQGDMILESDLQKAVHEFVISERVGKAMHEGEKIAELVESLVFTEQLQKALGIDLKKVGWFIGMKILSEDVWKRVKAGELKAFSIGGSGTRVEAEGGKS